MFTPSGAGVTVAFEDAPFKLISSKEAKHKSDAHKAVVIYSWDKCEYILNRLQVPIFSDRHLQHEAPNANKSLQSVMESPPAIPIGIERTFYIGNALALIFYGKARF